jgi:hypothetical protein
MRSDPYTVWSTPCLTSPHMAHLSFYQNHHDRPLQGQVWAHIYSLSPELMSSLGITTGSTRHASNLTVKGEDVWVTMANTQFPKWKRENSHSVIFFFFSFFFYYSYVHTRLGSFLPPPPTPSLTTHSTPSLSPHPLNTQQKLFCPYF